MNRNLVISEPIVPRSSRYLSLSRHCRWIGLDVIALEIQACMLHFKKGKSALCGDVLYFGLREGALNSVFITCGSIRESSCTVLIGILSLLLPLLL